MSNNFQWLHDLLPSFVENARIITYGYDARTHGSGHMTIQLPYDHAITFVTRLCTFRRDTQVRVAYTGQYVELADESEQTEQRPIVFLAHSLGGILVKSVSTASCDPPLVTTDGVIGSYTL